MTADSPNPFRDNISPVAPLKKSSKAKTIAIVVGLLIVVIVGPILLVIGATAMFVMTAKTEEVSDAERQLLVTADRVAEDWDYEKQPEFETYSKTTYIDGSKDVDYEYDPPDDNVYITCMIEFSLNRQDAKTSYLAEWGAAKLAYQEMELVERKDFYQWGDESRFYMVESEGEKYGNFFIARKGKCVYFFSCSGIYFDEPEKFEAAFAPVLSKVEGHNPHAAN